MRKWGIFLFLFMNCCLTAQFDSSDNFSETLIERNTDDLNEETEGTELFSILEFFSLNPVDLNKAELEELLSIPYMDPQYAKVILEYRRHNGRFFSVSELCMVKDLPPDIVSSIIKYVTVTVKPEPEKIIPSGARLKTGFRSRVIYDLQTKSGFKNNRFIGNPFKLYNRLNLSYGKDIACGILTEKDAGESDINDFTSFYLRVNNIYKLENLILGDYNIEFGQGLVLWSPYGSFKNAEAVTGVNKRKRGIVPYHSVQENNFFRGAAAGIRILNLNAILFISRSTFDAVIDSAGFITSTPLSGYHRSTNEILMKNSAVESAAGTSISFSPNESLSLQLLYTYFKFSNLRYASGSLQKDFNFSSLAYEYSLNLININGEAAFNFDNIALINNVYIPVNKNLKFICSFRYYPAHYFSFHGSAFGVNSTSVTDETGFYTGVSYKSAILNVSVFFDQYKFPVSSGTVFPEQGNEWSAVSLINLRPAELYLSGRLKEYESSEGKGYRKENYKLDIVYYADQGLRFKTRLSYTKSSPEISSFSEGYLCFQEVNFKFKKILNLSGRISFFRTGDFESAIYQYENDLPGVFRSISMYGEGLRWYLSLKLKVSERIMFSIKYAETFKPGEQSLSSGDSEIDGNLDNQVGIQLDVNF